MKKLGPAEVWRRDCAAERRLDERRPMTRYIQVVTTVASQDDARRLARELVAERLAACVQIAGPIESVYWWQGTIDTAAEWRCTLKSRADLYPQLAAAIGRLHSYETPEILSLPVLDGSPAYLAWLERELAPPASRAGGSLP